MIYVMYAVGMAWYQPDRAPMRPILPPSNTHQYVSERASSINDRIDNVCRTDTPWQSFVKELSHTMQLLHYNPRRSFVGEAVECCIVFEGDLALYISSYHMAKVL